MNIQKELFEDGYVFLPEWQKDKTIAEVASSIGNLIFPSKFLGYESINNVQNLIPKERDESSKHHYSGTFGIKEYPLHSDLAHWASPPKILMLRCVVGSNSVSTNILPIKFIIQELNDLSINRAVVKPRSNIKTPFLSMLPLKFKRDNLAAFRWDSLFLEPANKPAIKIKDYFIKTDLSSFYINFYLKERGDTLIINNWTTLHGRSSVPKSAMNRIIERVYIN